MISSTTTPQSRRRIAIQLYSSGYSYSRISKVIGRSKTRVAQYIKQSGLFDNVKGKHRNSRKGGRGLIYHKHCQACNGKFKTNSFGNDYCSRTCSRFIMRLSNN